MEPKKNPLRALRKDAKYDQEDLAKKMGVSQSQISKWEDDIDTASPSEIVRLAQILGTSIEELIGHLTPPNMPDPMSAGSPYRDFLKRLNIIWDYFNCKSEETENMSVQTLKLLREYIGKFMRKPLVGLSGRYDSGKSTLINELLGKNILPTSYQPMTSLPVLIMHSESKPVWMKPDEEVAIMPDTDINAIFESNAGDNRIAIGTASLLREFASYKGKYQVENARMAVAFIESPALCLCSFLDLPGYKSDLDDTAKVTAFEKDIDFLIYASPIISCMDQYDLPLMSKQLLTLPAFEDGYADFPLLGNFVLAITRCGRDETEEKIQETLSDIACRIFKHYKDDTIRNRSEIVGRQISKDDFQKRLIPFSKDVPRRRKGFISKIQDILSVQLPQIWEAKAKQAIESIRDKAIETETKAFTKITQLLNNQDQCIKDHETLKNNMPEIKKTIELIRTDINDYIKMYSCNSKVDFSSFFDSIISKESLVGIIDSQYDNDKKKTTNQIGSYLSERLGGKANNICTEYAKKLAERLNNRFDELAESINSLLPQLGINSGIEQPFGTADVRSMFISGLAGLGTLGALSLWAVTVAGGSNFGAYILVAKISGILTSMGISVAGPTLVSLVAYLGGPLVVGTGIGLIIAASTWGLFKLFGPSWQERLAEKIIKGMKNNDTLKLYTNNIEDYWVSTLRAIDKGFDAIVIKMDEELDTLRRMVEDGPDTIQELEKQLKQHERVKDFFEGMPRL
jgi:transcriptional regulator with XRE-family HTH domain